jgi:Tfp pilus assembly protein PilV
MSLIEVMIALVILSGALLALGRFVTQFTHNISTAGIKNTAIELASDRIETIKSATKYATIDSIYRGTETSIAGRPKFTRQTIIRRIGGGATDTLDYKLVTVIVSHPALSASIRKTTAIADY